MLEFENQQLIGKSLDSLFGSTAAFLAFAEQGQVQSSTGAIALDWPIRKSDGSLLWCAVSVSLIDLNQPEMGYICGLTDVSKLYGTQESLERTNAALLQARDEALSAVRAKSNFLANMSHEVRTPLHGILGTVELLRHTQLTPEQAEYASTISRSGDGLLSILNDILDYSKVEAGQLQIERAAFSILHDVHEVAILFKSRVDPSLVAFELHADESIPTHVEGDSIRFRQVISNLISNATKFTIRGKICVRLKRINADVDMCKIGIEVSDTGIGISSEQKAQLFRPFSQADSSTARRYGGSGLGLALVKRLVEAMGGTISLHSKLNVGSTFHVELPFGLVTCPATVDAKSPALRLALPSLVTESCPQPRVLIVEDIAVNRMIAKKLVESAGATVTVASNGIEAIDAYKRHSFDAILMDCQMPEMDGYEATTWIREFERGTQRHVPIIAMTAAAMAEDRKRCLDAGMDDYISKPVSGDSLMKCIGDWLLKSRRLDLM
jgi:signal transduction histidine kinase/ActR/RegA family two-component response regulator